MRPAITRIFPCGSYRMRQFEMYKLDARAHTSVLMAVGSVAGHACARLARHHPWVAN